ncbi:hypothetical protein VN12_12375 [Pirellula sp. SH-Sr6A]|uniref:hypothetical protein n=1 Tax=Pirellula sp. SH-Sr6A TaxID=1632865 RepID=UPI00078EF5C6|nr:hypothetical protein [Pirellula sp. SH-Sr6A]AMV32915.1 hypothetical protein VN12_12375 [Pirellula sp. SH-Sr6A]
MNNSCKNTSASTPLHKQLTNEDPLTGESGAHPIGTGLGAVVGGAATGAAVGSVAGPIGTVAGTVVGGIAGALAGKAIAEEVNPTVELEYWQSEYRNRPYYNEAFPFEWYARAYRAGWEASNDGHAWDQAEASAKQKFEVAAWENEGGALSMTWAEAREAARDAYERIQKRRRGQ